MVGRTVLNNTPVHCLHRPGSMAPFLGARPAVKSEHRLCSCRSTGRALSAGCWAGASVTQSSLRHVLGLLISRGFHLLSLKLLLSVTLLHEEKFVVMSSYFPF